MDIIDSSGNGEGVCGVELLFGSAEVLFSVSSHRVLDEIINILGENQDRIHKAANNVYPLKLVT